jgi:AcrR family transcriptional regulator
MTVRDRLLAAAAELIAEKGWGAVSTRVLADRAGVGSGVVHYHFDSTQAVLVQASVGALRTALAGADDRSRAPHCVGVDRGGHAGGFGVAAAR